MITIYHNGQFVDPYDETKEAVFDLTLSSYVLSHSLLPLFSSIKRIFKFIILLPAFLVLATLYIMLAPALRYIVHRRSNDLRKIIKEFNVEFANNRISKEDIIQGHDIAKKTLERIIPRLHKVHGEIIFTPKLEEFVRELKNFEQTLRVAAYPERNEIVLSYDELKELQESLRHFTPAEEESGYYDSISSWPNTQGET
jgi:hypothetical protein